MRLSLLSSVLWLLTLAFCPVANAADKPVPTSEAASKFTLPKGFTVTLFAGEPDIVQPIAFTFDDRGRMWVIECMMYPNWSQNGKGGKDRVVILEDTDGDGKYDKKTVVLDDGVNLSGIEIGFGGVYLCSSPNLIFIPIKDDKPAGKPEILIDGWNVKDTKHNVFNGLIWGPDGWLYGCNGIQSRSKLGRPGTPDKDRIFFDCGVWRFHPTRKVFDVVSNGTTNPWGVDFDENGEMFITNCVIDHLFHFVPGGHYTRMYGTDPNPYVYGYMGSCVDYRHWGSGAWTDSRADQKTGVLKKEHDDAGGGHAHSGAAIYLGDNFPAEYRNTLFTCNIHGNRLNNDGLVRTKVGMKGVRRPDFCFANDPWFRGICVKQGPAGELFFSDWSDTGECHNYVVVDASNGRLFRVVYEGHKAFKGDITKMSDQDLAKAVVANGNGWVLRRARLELQRRATTGTLDSAVEKQLRYDLGTRRTTTGILEAAWALHVIGKLTDADCALLLEHSLPAVVSWAGRLAFDEGKPAPKSVAKFTELCKTASDPQMRMLLASIIQRLPHESKWQPCLDLCRTNEATPADLAWLLWYAVEPLVPADPKLAIENLKAIQIPLVRQNIVRRFLSATEKTPESLALLSNALESSKDDGKRDILLGIREAYADRPTAKPLPRWADLPLTVGVSAEVRALSDELSIKFGDAVKIAAMKERILKASESAEARSDAIRLLARAKVPDLAPLLQSALEDAAVRGAALRALAAYPTDKTPAAILAIYGKLTADEKADAVQTLASRGTFALALLDAVEKGTVPKADITAFTARHIAAIKDKAVVAKLASVWGEVKPASANRKQLMDKYKAILTSEQLASANASRGRAIFAKNCATCHKLYGEGQAVGPELTGSQRSNLDYLLENVVDPSAVVANDYKMTQFYLVDGRVISGIVKADTGKAITVRTVNEEVVIQAGDIEQRKPTQLSIMPEGLFDTLKPEEVRDLVKYLMGKTQVPTGS